MRPAEPLAACNIPSPNQFLLISLIEVDAQTTDKYYEEKVLQVALVLCGSAVSSVTSYIYIEPVQKPA